MFRLLIRNKHNNKRGPACRRTGFTLIELLVYLAIFGIAAGLLSGILAVFVRVQSQEAAGAELTQQLSFVQSTIQRLVREAVNIENPAGVVSSVLTLRMTSPALDPTVISSDANAIYFKQGTGVVNSLTSSRVKVASFQVVKYENPGAHAIVQLDFSLTYNSQRTYQQITRGLKTSIGRVTAATFDDSLLPNAASNSFTVGNPTYPWKSLTLSNVLNLGQLTDDPQAGIPNGSIYYNSVDNAFRGYKNGAWADLGGAGWATNATNIYNTNLGNVGIGTTEPGVKLDVAGTVQMTGLQVNGNIGMNTAPVGTVGIYIPSLTLSGAGQYGMYMHAAASSEGTTAYTALRLDATSAAAAYTVANMYGLYIGDFTKGAGSTITNTTGIFVKDPPINATNQYGISLNMSVAANRWNVYAVGGAQNYFAGNVGIGTAVPGYNLEVAGSLPGIGFDADSIMLDDKGVLPNGRMWVENNYLVIDSPSAGHKFAVAGNETANVKMIINSTGNVGIGTTEPAYQLQLSTDSAAKPSTNTWTVASDERIKTDIRPFTDGLSAILGINPIWYKYNGLGGFTVDGKDNIGVIAQDIEKVAPYTVSSYYDKLNLTDATTTELLNFNSGALTFTTINAIKELNNEIEALKKRVEILETR